MSENVVSVENETKSPSVKETVVNRLARTGLAVRDAVIDILVKEETEKRVVAATKAVNKLSELEKELKKLSKPDVETFNVDMSPATSSFSKSRVEEIKKVREQIAKVEKALTEAFENNDFQKLLDLK
jgi:hypothetical protein